MPQWIQADLGSVEQIDSIRISFYDFERSRDYNYDIVFSMGEDTSLWGGYSNLVSEGKEWVTVGPLSYQSRFVKIILNSSSPIENNPPLWANIWEIEIWGVELK
jgi:hypothetical protein